MSDKSKEGTGALFMNKNKKSENSPDRTGSIHLGGKEYWLSGWLKKTKNGDTYLSVAVGNEKEARDERAKDEGGY